MRRALQIFPPSLVYIGIIATCSALGWLTLKPDDLVHAHTYTMNYHFHRAWWCDHLWSLSVEEQFYLLCPGLLFLRGSQRGSANRLERGSGGSNDSRNHVVCLSCQ